MIRFFADLTFLFFFLTLTCPFYPWWDHLSKTDPKRRARVCQKKIMWAFHCCLRFVKVKVITDGTENVPSDTAVLYVANHSSYYDILCSYVATPSGVGFFAKKEMDHIPFLSHWMRFINCLFLDRKDLKAGLKTINQGAEYLKMGFSMVIFPEGTRSQDEDPHDFKEGSLRPAYKAGVPIIPMAISGTADILENNKKYTAKPATVYITFGKPIDPDQLDRSEKKHLAASIRTEIIEMRKKHKTTALKDAIMSHDKINES